MFDSAFCEGSKIRKSRRLRHIRKGGRQWGAVKDAVSGIKKNPGQDWPGYGYSSINSSRVENSIFRLKFKYQPDRMVLRGNFPVRCRVGLLDLTAKNEPDIAEVEFNRTLEIKDLHHFCGASPCRIDLNLYKGRLSPAKDQYLKCSRNHRGPSLARFRSTEIRSSQIDGMCLEIQSHGPRPSFGRYIFQQTDIIRSMFFNYRQGTLSV